MGKRRRRNKARHNNPVAKEPVYEGPIATLLLGEGHNLGRSEVVHYVASAMDAAVKYRKKHGKE